MPMRILAASVLALGILAPVGAMADNNYYCSEEQKNRGLYIDCDGPVANSGTQYRFTPRDVGKVGGGPTGDFIDETAEESRQRSGND